MQFLRAVRALNMCWIEAEKFALIIKNDKRLTQTTFQNVTSFKAHVGKFYFVNRRRKGLDANMGTLISRGYSLISAGVVFFTLLFHY